MAWLVQLDVMVVMGWLSRGLTCVFVVREGDMVVFYDYRTTMREIELVSGGLAYV